MLHEFLKTLSPVLSFSRSRHIFNKTKAPGGKRYPGGIVYYPRYPDEKDPEYTPSKLFRVERIKPMKHNPKYCKHILRLLGIADEYKVNIVKNIPENNYKLWQVKHLVKVTPITFPYGEPTEEDINHTILKENGQCLVTKKLAVDPKVIEASEKFQNDPKKMNSDVLKKDSRLKWVNPMGGGY